MSSRNILLLVLLTASCSISAQIGAKVQQKSNLQGIWQTSQYGYQMTLILNPDGSGEFDGEELTFTYKDDKLTLLSGSGAVTYNYTLQGNSLLLSGGDLSEAITFNKPTEQDATNEVLIVSNPGPSSANDEGEIISPDNDLVGIWSASNESIEFKSNGQCAYLGQLYPYQVSQGQVSLTGPEGTVTFQYVIKGDQLTLTYNSNSVSYSKGSIKPAAVQEQLTSGNGKVAMEFVGKWCYINVNSYNQGASSSTECVTLNADGTYEYYNESSRSVNTPDFNGGTSSQDSDTGTWYVEGDRLFVHSYAKGNASYRLEKRNHPTNVNDPMIVLDGRAFITSYNKPPWR